MGAGNGDGGRAAALWLLCHGELLPEFTQVDYVAKSTAPQRGKSKWLSLKSLGCLTCPSRDDNPGSCVNLTWTPCFSDCAGKSHLGWSFLDPPHLEDEILDSWEPHDGDMEGWEPQAPGHINVIETKDVQLNPYDLFPVYAMSQRCGPRFQTRSICQVQSSVDLKPNLWGSVSAQLTNCQKALNETYPRFHCYARRLALKEGRHQVWRLCRSS